MDAAYVLALVAVTSSVAFLRGRARWGLRPAGLSAAGSRLLEWLGLAVLFLIANLALGFVAVLALRRVLGTFVSMYSNTDVSLVFLSLVQAVLFQWWRAGGRDPE